MKIAVQIPNMLREYCGERSELFVAGPTVAEALRELRDEHPALYRSICDETSALRPHISLFINSELVNARDPDGLDRQIAAEDELTIWTAVSGG